MRSIRKWADALEEHMSSGLVGISPRLLREARKEIVKALTRIFLSSLVISKIPVDWREANVVPLFKKGSRVESRNYRSGDSHQW